MHLSLGLCLALSIPAFTVAQEVEAPPQEEALRVFLDCQTIGCDSSYTRTEIDFVNWVRDREDSDIHLLISGQRTGGGGWSSDLFFIGRGDFEGRADTLQHFSSADDTQDARRRGLVQMMKIGLVRYVGETSGADLLQISLRSAEMGPGGPRRGPAAAVASAEDDPWNFWVFSASLNGSLGGETSSTRNSYSGSFSARRITEDWKVLFSGRGSFRESILDYEGYYSESFTRSWSGTATIVKSLTDHWSAGFKSSGSYSTYSNLDLALHGGPVLEYDVFPYSESTRRMLTFQYAIEGHHYDYMEPTIHGKLKERRVSESLAASLTLTQPWGSGMVFLEGEHFLDDFDQHHITFGAYLSFRLFRGLRFNVNGSYSRVKDLLSPVGGDLTEEELLLRLRQLQTDYRYSTSMGFSYTFGSIYNNIVNPRLESGFGGIMIMY